MRNDPDLANMFESEDEDEDDEEEYDPSAEPGSTSAAVRQHFKRAHSARYGRQHDAASSSSSGGLQRQGSGRGFKRGASAFR